jgi:hypothetical protein
MRLIEGGNDGERVGEKFVGRTLPCEVTVVESGLVLVESEEMCEMRRLTMLLL